MAKKRLSKIEKLEELLETATSQWCIVDTKNWFNYNEVDLQIDESVIQYSVSNKPKFDSNGMIQNNWSNDAQMDRVLVVDNGEELRFFDEKYDELSQSKVHYYGASDLNID